MTVLFGGFNLVEQLIFIDLKQPNTSTTICGLSVMISVVFELQIFNNSKYILDTLGQFNVTFLGQSTWIIRAIYYC